MISTSSWVKYVNGLYNIDKAAGDKVQYFKNIEGVAFDYGNEQRSSLIMLTAYQLNMAKLRPLLLAMYDEVGLASGLFLSQRFLLTWLHMKMLRKQSKEQPRPRTLRLSFLRCQGL